jgi:hypothetical protein
MVRLPKYKKDAEAAYKYAKKNNIIFSSEEENVLTQSPEVAIKYALNLKKERLSDFVNKKVFEYYSSLIKKTQKNKHSSVLHNFFDYLKMIKDVPDFCKNEILENIDPELLYIFAQILDNKLTEKYEKRMFQKCQQHNNLWPLVEYQFYLKTKLPDYMHNFMIAKNLESNCNSSKNAIEAYFLNLKDIKNILLKISLVFGKETKLKEIIEEL